MPAVLFITRIPTHYNDGTLIPEDVRQDITDQMARTIGGYTLEGPAQGAWVDEDCSTYSETSSRLEVSCGRERYAEARALVIALGPRLRQKAMYFEVRYCDGVEILAVPPPARERRRRPKRK
jgi:hypothetical protein